MWTKLHIADDHKWTHTRHNWKAWPLDTNQHGQRLAINTGFHVDQKTTNSGHLQCSNEPHTIYKFKYFNTEMCIYKYYPI